MNETCIPKITLEKYRRIVTPQSYIIIKLKIRMVFLNENYTVFPLLHKSNIAVYFT